jgi:hypothetical protein
MASQEEVEHAQRLIGIHKRNLEKLEEKKALLAGDLNISIDNQIAQEQADIAALLPLITPPPSKKVQEFVTSTSGGPPGEIDLMMLYLQGTQINTRMTQAEAQARGDWEKQAEQNKQIIDQQARDTLWRMQTKQVIDEVVGRLPLWLRTRCGGRCVLWDHRDGACGGRAQWGGLRDGTNDYRPGAHIARLRPRGRSRGPADCGRVEYARMAVGRLGVRLLLLHHSLRSDQGMTTILLALALWLLVGVIIGLLIGPHMHARVSDAEMFRRAVEQDAELDRRRLMQ